MKMKEQTKIEDLAMKYFDGRIAPDEEHELFGFISDSDENFARFNSWKKEWMSTHVADTALQREWRRLQTRIRLRYQTDSIKLTRRSVFRGIASVAAVAAICIAGTLGVTELARQLQPEKYFTVSAPLGEKSSTLLADGTVVWLNAGTTLTYSDRFGKSDRRVELSGEAYFEVAENRGKEFTVATRDYSVVVKGTKFNISAYPDDPFSSTTLSEGKVEVVRGKQHIEMLPGQSLRLDIADGRFSLNDVDAGLSHCWTENRLEYDNITLAELLAKLSRRYNVKITLESESADRTHFNISLRNDETISDVIEGLQEIIPLKVRREGDHIYLKHK